MSFTQIISFRTDHIDRFDALEAQWEADTTGRRTLVSSEVYVDRADPRHFVSVNHFPSYEAAMVNSALPETDALARTSTALCDGDVEFSDLDLVRVQDDRRRLADALRTDLVASQADPAHYAADVVMDAMFPHQVFSQTGLEALQAAMTDEARGRQVERWDVTTTEHGFAVEYAYRTTGTTPSFLSVGTFLATVGSGRISRLLVTCAGSWDAAAEAAALGVEAVSA